MDIYNRHTVLNDDSTQYINYVIIVFLLVCYFWSKTDDLLDKNVFLTLYLVSFFVSVILSEIIAKRITFIDNQGKETNKWKFKYLYFICCSVLTFLFSISVFVLFRCGFFWVYWIPVVVFAFNIAFIPNLYYPLFEDCLPVFY